MLWFTLLACTPDPATADDTDPGFVSEIYADPDHWLCHPDKADSVCDADLDVTVVQADGATSVEPHTPAADPAFDCFYLYPTVSGDLTTNSDLEPGVEEEFTTLIQLARYNRVCRPFAPVYRQLTITALLGGGDSAAGFAVAYDDVEEAWEHYLANDNDGRDVLLVGHSQGSVMGKLLISNAIEPDPEVHARLVGAHLIGMSVQVPEGADVGGELAETPICSSADEWGCVTTFLSFRPDDPPGADVFVGQPFPGLEVPCTHPAAVAQGSGPLGAVFPADVPGGFGELMGGTSTPWADPGSQPAIDTPFFSVPGLVSGTCEVEGRFGYLAVEVDADPADPRIDDIDGDFFPGWGLHLIDVNLAMSDLVDLAARQHAAR